MNPAIVKRGAYGASWEVSRRTNAPWIKTGALLAQFGWDDRESAEKWAAEYNERLEADATELEASKKYGF